MNKFGLFLIFAAICVLIGVGIYIINPLKILADRNDAVRISDLKSIARALELYYRDYGHYPNYNLEYVIETGDEIHPWGFAWMPYTERLPKDPDPSRRYIYWADRESNFQYFRLYASLQDPNATEGSCKPAFECSGVPSPQLCGTNNPCNFGVTSNNVSP